MPSEPAWDQIRVAFETSPETVAQIALRFGVKANQITYRRRKENWLKRPSGAEALAISAAKRAAMKGSGLSSFVPPLPPPAVRKRPARKAADPATPAPDAAAAKPDSAAALPRPRATPVRTYRQAIVARLFEVIDGRLSEMQASQRAGRELTALDGEREARDLANLVRSLEKAIELAHALARPAAAGNSGAAAPADLPGSAAAFAARAMAEEAEQYRRDIAERLARLTAASADKPAQ